MESDVVTDLGLKAVTEILTPLAAANDTAKLSQLGCDAEKVRTPWPNG